MLLAVIYVQFWKMILLSTIFTVSIKILCLLTILVSKYRVYHKYLEPYLLTILVLKFEIVFSTTC